MMTLGKVLIVDDEPSMCELLETTLQLRDFEPLWCTSADEALELVRQHDFDVVLTDVRMPKKSGLELCQELNRSRPDLPVVVMTAFGSLDTAIAAMRSGAYDFITKPIEMDLLVLTVRRAVERHQLGQQIRLLHQQVGQTDGAGELLGQSPPMKQLYDQLSQVGQSDAAVLITGESGTGKELVAREIHRRSSRSDNPFVAVNCAAISEHLLESELFGHTRGSFTGAQSDRKGLFLEADGGTLLLDELGDMPMAMQVKLLRALEESKVRPVGGDREVSFDVRVLSATHKDLESAIDRETFRQDLFYRINVIQMHLPPLRSRGTDVLLLAQHFTSRFAQSTHKQVAGISDSAAKHLLNYSWPGNIRELKNVIERAVALTHHTSITLDDLPEKIRSHRGTTVFIGGDDPLELVSLEELQRRYIDHVLQAVDQNQTQAAKILGVDRKTLYRRLKSNASQ